VKTEEMANLILNRYFNVKNILDDISATNPNYDFLEFVCLNPEFLYLVRYNFYILEGESALVGCS